VVTRETYLGTEIDELIVLLRTHGEREGATLASYERLVEESADEGLRYVASLILDDERRHHAQLREMLNELEAFAWDLQPSLPILSKQTNDGLRAETRRLLALERKDAKELRRLRKSLTLGQRSALLPLLVSLMIHDSAKHVEILEFIRKHLLTR